MVCTGIPHVIKNRITGLCNPQVFTGLAIMLYKPKWCNTQPRLLYLLVSILPPLQNSHMKMSGMLVGSKVASRLEHPSLYLDLESQATSFSDRYRRVPPRGCVVRGRGRGRLL